MLISVRRIVTHNDDNGHSYALYDGNANHIIGDFLTELWTTTSIPHDFSSMQDAALLSKRLEPTTGGTLFRFFQLPPDSQSSSLSLTEKREYWTKWFKHMDAAHAQPDNYRHPNMHVTRTTDYIVLLQGEVTLILDKSEHDLKPFDVVIQRGTNHAWVNRGTQDALIMAVLVNSGSPPGSNEQEVK